MYSYIFGDEKSHKTIKNILNLHWDTRWQPTIDFQDGHHRNPFFLVSQHPIDLEPSLTPEHEQYHSSWQLRHGREEVGTIHS